MKKYLIGLGIMVLLFVLNVGCARKMERLNPFDPGSTLSSGGGGSGGGGGNDTYTKLLLHMDGTNGDSLFTDSSPIGRTVYVVNDGGLPTTSSTQVKFGLTSYFGPGTGAGGNGGCLSIAASQDFNPGSGDFTVDFWLYHGTIHQYTIFGYYSKGIALYQASPLNTNSICLCVSSDGSNWDIFNNVDANRPPDVLVQNAWNHVALVRYGSVWTCYVNGVSYFTFTSSVAVSPTCGTTAFMPFHWDGHALNDFRGGYIDEFRFSKGIARWTANFTPPAAPY